MAKVLGGHAVACVLTREGVKKIFCVPGESFLSVMDGLYDYKDIELIATRHEGGASFMAEAYAKASGSVGVCMATRGVGSANLAIGIHTAHQDSTPMVALIGQVERPFKGKEAFQEVNLVSLFGHLCKWTVEIDRADRIPELLHRAFHVARSGRPGPVMVSLPHDMLEDTLEQTESIPYQEHSVRPDLTSVAQAVQYLQDAERPVLIVGGGVIRSQATSYLVKLAEELKLPVVTAFRRYDAFPNSHRCYAGWLGFGTPKYLLDAIKRADVVLALGTRFSQVSTNDYTLLSEASQLIHVDISPETMGKVYPPTLPIVSDAKQFLIEAIAACEHNLPLGHSVYSVRAERAERAGHVDSLHAQYLVFSSTRKEYTEDFVDLDGMMHDLLQVLPNDAIVTSDAGNFFGWLAKYYRFNHETTYIGPTSGAMGYGLPAAIGAKLARPDRTVVSFSGDGGFLMTGQELETAVRHHIPVIAIVVNNNIYGTIRAHQERHFPGRVIATELTNPNFAELAKVYGAHGERVERNSEFLSALQRALESGRPAVIEVLTNPEILSVNHPRKKRL